MVPVTAKVIVSPSFAMASAWRSEPAPLSFVLVTVMVAACAGIATAQSSTTAIPVNVILGVILIFIALVTTGNERSDSQIICVGNNRTALAN
ncbi:MAG: hypothetical protein DMF26_11630 [Verrucomicrobia bacterium]|nr:MAG: hypothetical protein DMF26_11630 [Verrucomicrobiota bacterium]